MYSRDRARLKLSALLVVAFLAVPVRAVAQPVPATPVILSPRPSAAVASTFVITGRVGPGVTEVRVTGADDPAVTLFAADSEGATFTATVTVRYGSSTLTVVAGDGVTWSGPASRTVWQLGDAPTDRRLVLVDKSDFMLYVLRYHSVIEARPIAIGMRGTPTPTGAFRLGRPVPPGPGGSVWGPFRMRLYRKVWVRASYVVHVGGHHVRRWRRVLRSVPTSYYIHGTSDPGSIGTPASHGCVRMWNSDLRVLRGLTFKGQRTIIRN
jgi:lipoprotein-anchoring transpeptidase ErfK/SrfK